MRSCGARAWRAVEDRRAAVVVERVAPLRKSQRARAKCNEPGTPEGVDAFALT